MEHWALFLSAVTELLWLLVTAAAVVYLLPHLTTAVRAGSVELALFGNQVVVKPTRGGQLAPGTAGNRSESLEAVPDKAPLPADYLFLDHISFLREEKQAEFQEITGVDAPHFDIRVVLDSDYDGALERVLSVEYILHESYPDGHVRQVRGDRRDRFLLKELAYGEFLLLAQVTLRDRKKPVVLQRYISLIETDEETWRDWLQEVGRAQ